jgi:DNA modification methylase
VWGAEEVSVRVLHGDCLDILPTLPADSFHSVCCDPPYHLTSIVKRFGAANAAPCKVGATGAFARASRGFMGKQWDGGDIAFRPETWAAVYRVMKPGAHLAAFGGSRTYHRMACAIEDAGFEIRDTLCWLYGSGFPKSHDVSKGIDKILGAEREKSRTIAMQKKGAIGEISKNLRCAACGKARASSNPCVCPRLEDEPVTQVAAAWQGWGTALKPAFEPIILARKPLVGTVAANTLTHGVGGINIDACRIDLAADDKLHAGITGRDGTALDTADNDGAWGFKAVDRAPGLGRWPANVLHDGSDEVMAAFPDALGAVSNGRKGIAGLYEDGIGSAQQTASYADSGSAARFFYCAKADSDDRAGTTHPTTKPTSLMIWLAKLITPPGGMVLDPFAGSGSTGVACVRQGFDVTLIEREAEYIEMIKSRLRQEGVRGQEADLTISQPKHDPQFALGLF